jgi:hypothetical protein
MAWRLSVCGIPYYRAGATHRSRGIIMDTQQPAGAEATAAAAAAMLPTAFDRRLQLVVVHLLAGVTVLALWAATDAWQAVTALPAARLLSVLAAVPAGLVFSTLIHEWCHLLGARLAAAAYSVPAKPGLFVFNFDFRQNSLQQFRMMSYAGQAGSVLAVLLVWWALPLDSGGRAMLFSATVGSGVFGALIEWPVLARTRASGNPLAELAKIDKALLYRSASIAGAATLLLWAIVV